MNIKNNTTPETINILNNLLNKEVSIKQLKQIDSELSYLLEPTKKAKNHHVTHGILLMYNTSDLAIRIKEYEMKQANKSANIYMLIGKQYETLVTNNPSTSYVQQLIINNRRK